MTSPGKIEEYGFQATPGTIAAKLYNFEVGKFDIKPEHYNWLISVAVPKLRSGGSLTIIGLASRSGTDAFNMKLSEDRLRNVIALLRKQVPNNFKVAVEVAKGERAAMYAGEMDGVEQETWRGVVISVWNKPEPPPHLHRRLDPHHDQRRLSVTSNSQSVGSVLGSRLADMGLSPGTRALPHTS